MILNMEEVRTVSIMFSKLDYSSLDVSMKCIWDSFYEEIKNPNQDVKLRTKDLAFRWSMDKQSIVNMRKDERGPAYIKTDTGAILYDLADVIEYEKLRVIKPRLPL